MKKEALTNGYDKISRIKFIAKHMMHTDMA